MAAVCDPNNIGLNVMVTICSIPVTMVAAGIIGAPILTAGALGTLTVLVSAFAMDFFKNMFDIANNGIVHFILATVVHIASSLLWREFLFF